MTPEQLASSPKTFKERDDWMRAVLASDLPDAAARLAVRIALYLQVTTGRCNPSYATLAAESHVAERSVYRLVALLEHRGWIAVQRTGGRGNAYNYVLLSAANYVAVFHAEKLCQPFGSVSDKNSANSTDKPRHPSGSVSAVNSATIAAVEQKKERREEEQREERDTAAIDFFWFVSIGWQEEKNEGRGADARRRRRGV